METIFSTVFNEENIFLLNEPWTSLNKIYLRRHQMSLIK